MTLFSGNCDFERGKCTWTNTLVGDTFDWRRSKGGTPSGRTGPSTDHTRQDSSGTTMSLGMDLVFMIFYGVMYSGVECVCGVTLSLYPHRAS